MTIPSVSQAPNYTPPSASQAGSGTKPGTGSGGDDLLDQAEKIAREGFELSLKAKQITNKYSAAKEVR